MNKFYQIVILVAFQFVNAGVLQAQFLTENTSDKKDMTAATDMYYKALGVQAGLYNGVAYTAYGRVIKEGHQYFEATEKDLGSVFYDGIQYKQVPMWYDLIKDQVIVEHPGGYLKVVLHNELVKNFTIYNHTFIRYEHDSTLASSPPTGYYDQIYKGQAEVLVNRSKSYIEKISLEGIWFIVLKQRNDRYLMKDGEYFRISNQGSILRILESKQKEIQAYLKKNKVKFRKDPEKAIVMMVSYYEQIGG